MEKSIFTPEYEALSRVLVRCRQAAGLTQIELAEAIQTTQSSVSKLERGALRLDVIQLRTVCKALGISLSEFVQKLEPLSTKLYIHQAGACYVAAGPI